MCDAGQKAAVWTAGASVFEAGGCKDEGAIKSEMRR
jgi:hypothetical protein